MPYSFSTAELQRIQYIWQRVAEDYSAFDVDVTTEAVPLDQITRSGLSRIDLRLGTLTQWLNVLGMPGMTAYFGLMDVGQPQPGIGEQAPSPRQQDPVDQRAVAGALGGQPPDLRGIPLVDGHPGAVGAGDKEAVADAVADVQAIKRRIGGVAPGTGGSMTSGCFWITCSGWARPKPG